MERSGILGEFFVDGSALLLTVLVFLATAVLTFGVMLAMRSRSAIKRRAAGIAEYSGDADEARSLGASSLRAVQRLLDYATKHYAVSEKDKNKGEMKMLRRRMIQAGIFDVRAVAYFFLARTALAVVAAASAFLFLPLFVELTVTMLWLAVIACGIAGYVAPSMYLDRRVVRRRNEHRVGFPDFMDLLVVCADSGLSMEAALERVPRARRVLSFALHQPAHGQSRNPCRTLHDRGARSSGGSARPRGGTLVCYPHPAVGRARLEHHRCVARLQRRHAPQTPFACRREGIQLTREAGPPH
jgi:nitrate reductase gamma subunit